MKYPIALLAISLGLILSPNAVFAQTPPSPDSPSNETLTQAAPEDITSSAENQGSLLPRIYASDTKITSPANNHKITGTFTVRNSEAATIGGVKYEILLLDPLESSPINTLVADNPNVYDRILSSETLTLQAKERRTVPFAYTAPNVPQGSYRVRIQITTTNDRKLGWDDATVTLGGSDAFVIVRPLNVSVASSDPITNEKNTVWQPLYGVNVDPAYKLSFSAILQHVGSKTAKGTITISTKRLLYADETPAITKGPSISVAQNESKEMQIPITTQKTPGAYIILITVNDAAGNKISGVGEYRYVVRGQSASIASVQVQSIPSAQNALAKISFVLAGSADRNTPVAGKMNIDIADKNGVAGSITKDFSIGAEAPAVGDAQIAMLRTLCGTPTVTITLKNSAGSQLDSYSVEAAAFANPTCTRPFLSFILSKPFLNTSIAIAILVILIILYKLRSKNR